MTPTVSLGRVAAFHKGAGLSKAGLRADGRVRCVHYGELFTKYGAVIRSTTSRTDEQLPVSSVAGDVLMPTSDVTPRGLAKASAIMLSGVALGGDILVIRPDKSRVDSRYLAYALRHDENQVLSFVRGSTVYHLYAADMRHFELELPSKREQSVIADMLEHLDSLIHARERLIAKKLAIKQGLIQSLITGGTRLPGFEGEWPLVTLGESGVVTGGGIDKTSNPLEPSVFLLNYMDVYRSEFLNRQSVKQIVTAPSSKISKCSIQAGDVFFTPTSETPDDIARSAVADADLPGVAYSYHLVRWRPGPGWDRSFLAYAFSTEAFRSQVSTLAAGSGTRYVLSMPGFRSLAVPRPPLDEQRAIGAVLRDVSTEVSVMTRRLAKARALRTGMMQQLLTGRVRLPVEAAS